MIPKKSYAAAAACIAVLVLAAAWWLRAQPSKAAQSAAPASALVTVASAQKVDVPIEVTVNGNVVSLNSVDVKPQVSNVVQKVHVKEGDFVRAGQPLFTLDSRADQASLQKAKAQQLKDQAT